MQKGDAPDKDGRQGSRRPDLKAISKASFKLMSKYNICIKDFQWVYNIKIIIFVLFSWGSFLGGVLVALYL